MGYGNPTDEQIGTTFFRPPLKTPREALAMMKSAPDPRTVAAAFAAFRVLTGSKVPTFDIPAAERWCADNQNRCDQPAPQQQPSSK